MVRVTDFGWGTARGACGCAAIALLVTRLSAIETQLRDMKHTKLQSRVADLEEEVFGKVRA